MSDNQQDIPDLFDGIDVDKIGLSPYLGPETGSFVNPPQEPHGDSSPCSALLQATDPHDLSGTSYLHSFQFNPLQELYGDSQPPCNEPMPVVSPQNPDNVSFFQPQSFSSRQGSREEATHESLPRRQHSKPLRSLLPKPPGNNATSPQPARYDNSPSSISCSSSSPCIPRVTFITSSFSHKFVRVRVLSRYLPIHYWLSNS